MSHQPGGTPTNINEILEYEDYDLEDWIHSNGKHEKATCPIYHTEEDEKGEGSE